ncbi:hypothetical protein GH714_002291 [Hevea brasiliensis]|uniref:F-box associated beta-propeller type 1 domain-containing protein n=1 Tax=Hevea brasiliensis TaxID=3981 RepID=A0A6A6KWX4_HEVBR|nr:hypothetical protein GH714_002291 [Hevea brasiliensis]
MQMRFQDLVLFDRRPFFHSPTSQENAARNSGLLFFSYSTRELVWPFKENVRYLLYPDESFPANPVEELDCPFKGVKRFVNIVGSCNGVFCLSDDVYGKYAEKAFLWNPSVRKIVNIPCPNLRLTHMDPIYPHLGLAFLTTDDYKLVRIVYSHFIFDEIRPFVEIYSLRSRGWRKVKKDLKYFITARSTSAFLNGACHWVATKRGNGPGVRDVIVSFSLGEEVFGEMEKKSLIQKFGACTLLLLDTFVESLVLLDETNEFTEVEASEDNSTNEILEDVASSSNSQLVIDEANGEPKEEAQGESISTQ